MAHTPQCSWVGDHPTGKSPPSTSEKDRGCRGIHVGIAIHYVEVEGATRSATPAMTEKGQEGPFRLRS
jgi:hypothetical protein